MSISIPGADYSPQLAGYTGQGAFRFWCQKVLPIVYDDSLSYYELLNKVVNYLNNVIADVANVEDNVGRLNDSYGLLQTYVNEHMQEIVDVVNEYTEFTTNYFDNLDVQEEINTKLDTMATDGSLSALIGPIVAITAPDIITQWLTDHITPTEPLIDSSLTVSGAGADAKVTGDYIREFRPDILSMNGDIDFQWVDGMVLQPNGLATTDSNYATTAYFMPLIPNSKITVYTRLNGEASIVIYKEDKSTVDASYQKTSASAGIMYPYEINLSNEARFMRFSCQINEKANAYVAREKQDKLTFDDSPESKSKNPVTSGGVFDATNALALFAGGELIYDFINARGYDLTGNTVDVNNPDVVSTVSCVCVPCNENDTFTYTGSGTSTYRQYGFVSSNGTILERGLTKKSNKLVVVAPANSAYAVFNFHNVAGRGLIRGELPHLNTDEITNMLSGYGFNTTGDSINLLNPTMNNSVGCSFIRCKGGDKFTYSGRASNSYRQYAFLDVNGNILAKGENEPDVSNKIITAPPNSAFVVFNWLLIYDNKHIYYGCDENFGMFNFAGANVAIIGDSISTNGNYSASNPQGNVPEIVIHQEDVGVSLSAYVTFYDVGTTIGGRTITEDDIGNEITFTPTASDIGKMVGVPNNSNNTSVITWWEVAKEVLGFNVIPVCWSGSSITSHEGDRPTYKTSYAWHPAQIRKCGIRVPGSMTRTAPDMVIIFRGVNDFSHVPYAVMDDNYFDGNWTAPSSDYSGESYDLKAGYSLVIKRLRDAYPSTVIVIATCNFFKRIHYNTYPVNNGLYSENQLNNAIREIADWFGCGVIEFDKDGLTFENASQEYYQDSAAFTHPTTKGHAILGNKAILDLKRISKF